MKKSLIILVTISLNQVFSTTIKEENYSLNKLKQTHVRFNKSHSWGSQSVCHEHTDDVQFQFFKFSSNANIFFMSDGNIKGMEDYAKSMDALYFGNGPIYDPGFKTKGYLKSDHIVIEPIDCSKNAFEKDGNYSVHNSILMKFKEVDKRLVKEEKDENGKNVIRAKYFYNGKYKWELLPTSFVCSQLELPQYKNYILGSEKYNFTDMNQVEDYLRSSKVMPDVDTTNDPVFYSADQVHTAVQSGATILRDKVNLVENYKGEAPGTRSFVGITNDHELAVLEVKGHAGFGCIGEVAKYVGNMRDLLHRDSNVIGSKYRLSIDNEYQEVEFKNSIIGDGNGQTVGHTFFIK